MSNLYVRVMTGFYSHRKTIRLKVRLGMDAYWIPPRIWAYAAEHQADGNLSSYSSEELAELIGYSSNATSMLQALKDCGFVDPDGVIHGWSEHNGYHERYSERAKTAAAARWGKKKPPTPPKEIGKGKGDSGDKHCNEHAYSITPETIYAEYPLKVGRPVALRSIAKAMLKVEPVKLLELTKAYAIRRAGDKSFVPHPSTWFNQERYLDDPSTWNNHENYSKPNGQRVDRSVGTTNEGLADQYEGVGRMAPV